MRVHQMPVLPEPPRPRPAPKNSEAARLRAEFEDIAALMDERHQEKGREPPPERKAETGPVATGAPPEPDRVVTSNGIDLLV